ncbi:MAG: hypothetical protein IKX79_01300, partial [Desulfovibrionaceae bacterium]|nr:hypothetical protein [Desulfovibrionaceae bacterium]
GTERRVCFEQLVTDSSDNKSRSDSGGSLFSEISPVYNDGTTTLMREFSVRYKVSNGTSLGDITITNLNPSRDFAKNVSIGYGLYRDSTTGGQDVLVQVQFSNRMRFPLKMTAYETDSNGRIIGMRGMLPRTDGVFRPEVTVLDANFNKRRTYGPPMPLSSGVFLLTVDMIDDGAQVGDIIAAETMNGAKAYAVSPVVPVRHNQEQVSLRENARQNGLGNLFGKYAMIELASFRKDPVLALPTFQTVEFHNTQPNFSFTARQGEKTSGSGLLNWMPLGLPQISLHRKSTLPGVPLGDTIQTWYAFLKGQGPERVWYCIGMGDGTRWALVPLEQYQEQFLEGVWISDTERWEFKGNTVQLTRDGHTGRGTFHLKEHILSATNMPADEYAVYLDREHGRMTLITRRGVASILTREGMAQPSAGTGGSQAPQAAPPAAQALAGQWLSGPETGYARLSITPVPGTQFFNLRLVSQGQGETVCTFAVSGQQLLATFRDNSRAIIRYALINNSLTLFFPNMPEIRFTRQ